MSDGWHYLAFGVELGPMSWDDLVQRAVRGDLLPDSHVRDGAKGAWLPAREIPQLFAAGGEAPAADAWHCEFMGAELGPMSWDDLRRLVVRGDVRGDSRVRNHAHQEWRLAATIAGLFPPSGDAAADADFEFTGNSSASEEDAATILPPEAAPPAPISPPPATVDPAVASGSAGGLKKQDKKPEKKKAEKAPKPKVARAPIELALPPQFAKGLAAALLMGGAGWLAYFGYTHLGSGQSDELRTAAAGFEHIYGEVQQFRKNPKGGPPQGIGIQVMPRLASLRHRLSQVPAESAGGALNQAGARLAEMLADGGLGAGESGAKYAEAEQQFLALLDEAKKQLGQ